MTHFTPAALAAALSANPDIALAEPDALTEAPPRRVQAGSEAALQAAVIAEAERRSLSDARWGLLFHVPSGEYRRKATAGRLKAMGVKAGVPDLMLAVPNPSKGFCGAFIELKVKSNRPTPQQRTWMANLAAQGYFVACVYDDAAEVIRILEWYLDEGA